VEDEELAPTMKLRRKAVEQKFADTFARLYDDPAFGLPIPTTPPPDRWKSGQSAG
jgi:hypothetical protein